MSPAPLDGVRVLDLSRVLAGPWCTMTLADLGAEVWKIERPGSGDDTRAWRPPQTADGEASYFLAVNRNKRSVAIDFTTPDGNRVVRELAARADVVVENYKTGALARYGLDAATLRGADPRLIYCSISGYGRTGPLADRAGYDFVAQAETGFMAITGEPDGTPMKVGVAVVDVLTGNTAIQAILAALIARGRDGTGQEIDVALNDVALASLANVGAGALAGGEEARRFGNDHASIVPYRSFATRTGDVVIAVGNDPQFRALCVELGIAEVADDPRFATNVARVANRAATFAVLEPAFAARDRAPLLEALAARGVPSGAVDGPLAALRSPAAVARGMTARVTRDDGTAYETTVSPLHLSRTPVVTPGPAPRLGEHTATVLRDVLGYDDARIAALHATGAIG